MPRAVLVLVLVLVAVALATPLSSGAFTGATSSGRHVADDPGSVTLRARIHEGPWKKSLYLKLVQLRLTNFSLCAIWNQPAGEAFDCNTAAQNKLPAGTTLRLEQSPVGRALKRADSPGWGMVGASGNAAVGAVVSNILTGNRRGTYRYRVTLRDRSNQVLVTSNTFTLTWH
jgi:hypothetical protein